MRAFSTVSEGSLKASARPDWPALLHNLCFLHCSIRLRATFGQNGFCSPSDMLKIGLGALLIATLYEHSDTLYRTDTLLCFTECANNIQYS